MPAQWSARTDRLLEWLIQYQSVTRAWILRRTICSDKKLHRNYHCCCMTYRPPIEWGCRVIHEQLFCNIPGCTDLHSGCSSCWVLEISYHFPSTTIEVMNAHKGEHLSDILLYEFGHWTKIGRMCVIKVSFSQVQVGFMDQRCTKTPQFVTTELDISIPSFHWRLLLPATYSTILWFILHHIVLL